jgi:4-hydroxybenzoate polyprenyltransferase
MEDAEESRVMHKLERIKQSLRWNHWAQGKVPLFCVTMFYLILKQSLFSMHTIGQFVVFLIFISLVSIYGYLINDLFDMEIDRIHGKKNVFEKTGRSWGGLVVFLVFSVGILFGSAFLLKDYFPYLLVLIYSFATFYSAPPVRFKERGIAGLFIAFLTQYPIPIMMVFSAFDSFATIDMWGFVLFATVSGAALIIGHQRYDLQRDRSTRTKTFAVRAGNTIVDRIYEVFVFLDMISMFGIMVIMGIELRRADIYGRSMVMLPPLFVYLLLALVATKKIIDEKTHLVDPYYVEGRNDIFNLTYSLFPDFALPFYLSCVACIHYPIFLVCAAIFLLLTFVNFPRANFVWPIKVVYDELRGLIRGR